MRNDLGVARQRLGHFEDAIAAYEDALTREPDKLDSHLNLANALLIVGRPAAALPHAAFVLAARPHDQTALVLTALAEGLLDGFERTLTRLAGRHDEDPAVLQLRVFALRRLERFDEAAVEAERLMHRYPSGDAYELLAACKRDLGAHRDALSLLDEAVARGANPASALAAAGDVLIELGDLDAAAARFRAATAADPGSVSAWCGRVRLERLHTDDLARLEAMLAAPPLAAREPRIVLHFTLANAHLAAGNDARAFALFAEGNRLKRESIRYDAGDDEAHMAAIASAFDAATIERLRARSSRAFRPIIVMGLPRSGTTLVEQILASFPGVHGAGETFASRTAIASAIAYPDDVPHLSAADVARVGDAYAAALAAAGPAEHRIVDKLPSNFLYAGLLHAMLPEATLVMCTRDALDNGLSLYTELFAGRQDFAYDLTEIGRYIRAERRLAAHWRAILPTAVHIAYEELVTDFEPTVRRLAAACGLPWNARALRFWETPRPVVTASRIAVRRPLFRSSVGRAARYAAYLEPLARVLSAP